jgi:serine/threonine protein kinase
MDKFQLIRNLGEGTFGSAVLATNLRTGEQVAIKMMKKRYDTWEECIQLREVKLL